MVERLFQKSALEQGEKLGGVTFCFSLKVSKSIIQADYTRSFLGLLNLYKHIAGKEHSQQPLESKDSKTHLFVLNQSNMFSKTHFLMLSDIGSGPRVSPSIALASKACSAD